MYFVGSNKNYKQSQGNIRVIDARNNSPPGVKNSHRHDIEFLQMYGKAQKKYIAEEGPYEENEKLLKSVSFNMRNDQGEKYSLSCCALYANVIEGKLSIELCTLPS